MSMSMTTQCGKEDNQSEDGLKAEYTNNQTHRTANSNLCYNINTSHGITLKF